MKRTPILNFKSAPVRKPRGHLCRRKRYFAIGRPRFNPVRYALRFVPGEWLLINRNNGQVLDCSHEFARLTRLSRATLRRTNLRQLAFKGDEVGWQLKRLDLELLSHPGRYEDVGITSPENFSYILDIRVTHLQAGPQPGAFCLVTDKSHQRQLQGELIAKHQEIKRAFNQLEERTRELEAARETLRQRNREISRLSAQMMNTNAMATIGEIAAELTHQLNNPLAAATGAARKLTRILDDHPAPKVHTMVPLLNNALNRMKETIDEVHAIYRHSRVPNTPKTALNVDEHLQNALALLANKTETVSVRQHVEDQLLPIWGHRSWFEHVLVNVIDNALDAAKTPARVNIHVRMEGAPPKVTIKVEDNGDGIEPSMVNRIFEPFFTTKKKGSGLGLSAVKRYVERDDATIDVASSTLGGAAFILRYPTVLEKPTP